MRCTLLAAALLCCFGPIARPQGGTKGAAAAKPSALDKFTLEQYVRHLFVWGPQIQVNVSDPTPSTQLPGFQQVTVTAMAGGASQQESFLISRDGQKIVRGVVFNVAESPFSADAARIKTENQPSFGPAGAPVQLVVYSDFQCSYRKEEAKVLREQVAKAYPNDVQVYFKDYPLVQIHPWAKPAAVAGRCIYRQNPAAFWDFHDWIFGKQAEITGENLKQQVLEFAKTKGIETLQLGACLDKKATEPEVDRAMAEGRTLGINSTPTVYLNGRRLVGQVGLPQLKQIIDHEIAYQKTQGAGEKCCETTLPLPK